MAMAAVHKTAYDFETERLSQDSIDVPFNDKLLNELVDDYSKYMCNDFGRQDKMLQETIEEMLLRLDEFVTLIDMIRSDNSQCISRTLPSIYEKFDRLNEMKEKIDKLEAFVKIVEKNLNVMEEKVVFAEEELRQESSIEKVFKPFFKKDSPMKRNKNRSKPVYEKPEILKVSDYFHPNESDADLDETLDEACALPSTISE